MLIRILVHCLKTLADFLQQIQFAVDGFSVIEFAGFHAVYFVFPELRSFQIDKAEFSGPRFFGPDFRLLPVIQGGAKARFRRFKAFQILLFPGGVVKIRVPLVPLVSQKQVLFNEFDVYVHGKQVAVFFPLGFILNQGKRVQGIGKIGF